MVDMEAVLKQQLENRGNLELIAEQPIEEMNLVEIRSHDAPNLDVQKTREQVEKLAATQ